MFRYKRLTNLGPLAGALQGTELPIFLSGFHHGIAWQAFQRSWPDPGQESAQPLLLPSGGGRLSSWALAEDFDRTSPPGARPAKTHRIWQSNPMAVPHVRHDASPLRPDFMGFGRAGPTTEAERAPAPQKGPVLGGCVLYVERADRRSRCQFMSCCHTSSRSRQIVGALVSIR